MDKNIAENSSTGGVTKRWKPTVQQKEILEYLYKTGLKSPSVEDIERITVVLKNYGRVEGKNVFYWFQNFNAREREQRRRAESSQSFKGEEASRGTTLSIENLIGIADQLERQRRETQREDGEVSDEQLGKEYLASQTLELFPLKPDGGGLGRSPNTRFAEG